MASDKPRYVNLELMKGVAGEALYLDGYRIDGPSDNGMMKLVRQWRIRADHVARALNLTVAG